MFNHSNIVTIFSDNSSTTFWTNCRKIFDLIIKDFISVINKVKFKNSNTFILKYLTILLYNLYRTYFPFYN